MPCSYCETPGHGMDVCPERLEDKFGTAADFDVDEDDIRTDGGLENSAPVQFNDAIPNNECLGCGGHVQPGTIRVYGDNDGRLFSCPSCSTPRDLRQGAGRDPNYDPEVNRGKSTASGYHPIFPQRGGED